MIRGLEHQTFEYRHLSPKKWLKGLLVGTAALTGVANLVTAVPTAGITLPSAVQMLGAVIQGIVAWKF